MVDFMTETIMADGFLAVRLDAQRSGTVRDVDTDLPSAALHQTSYPALRYMNDNDLTERTLRSACANATSSQMVKAADGWMFVMCQLTKFWNILCQRTDHADLASDRLFCNSPDRLPNLAAPLLGADSDALLSELGYDADAVAGLRAGGVV